MNDIEEQIMCNMTEEEGIRRRNRFVEYLLSSDIVYINDEQQESVNAIYHQLNEEEIDFVIFNMNKTFSVYTKIRIEPLIIELYTKKIHFPFDEIKE